MKGMTTTNPPRSLSCLDRLCVALVRRLLARLQARVSIAEHRVWWAGTRTFRPSGRMWLPTEVIEGWPEGQQAGYLDVGFGGTEAEAMDPPMIRMYLTRPTLDQLIDGAVEVRRLQDEQIRALAERRRP